MGEDLDLDLDLDLGESADFNFFGLAFFLGLRVCFLGDGIGDVVDVNVDVASSSMSRARLTICVFEMRAKRLDVKLCTCENRQGKVVKLSMRKGREINVARISRIQSI